MVKRKLAIMTIAIAISAFVTTSASAAAQTKRLWGSDRYETGSAIVEEGWQSTSYYAVIVNGENFPDALSAAPLAKMYNAPILLTQDNTLDSNTASELKRLNVKSVFIVGGEGVVRPSIEKALNDLGIQTTRYKGQDRNETSIKVANQIGTKNGIIVATDSDYADALSAAPIAANLQMPIILVSKNAITSELKNFIFMNYIPKTYVLGDTDIISDGVAGMFPNVQRITGKDKYERNVGVMKAFEDKLNFNNVCLAYSEKFADALSGSVLAAGNGNPIVLIGDELSPSTSDYIKSKSSSINKFTILGGTAGIKDSIVTQLTNGTSSNTSTDTDTDVTVNDNEGNTEGNLRNGGFIVEKDGWIYYIKNGKKIYRIRTDGTQETLVADVKNARSLNVVGSNIYYVGSSDTSSSSYGTTDSVSMYKGSVGGGYRTTLYSEHEDDFGKGFPYMKAIDHWVCYSPNLAYITKENSSFYDCFYKIDVDTKVNKQSTGDYLKSLATEGGFMYFTTKDDNTIRKMPTSGNKKSDGTPDNKEVDLGVRGTILDVQNGYIYYNDADGNTYKMKEDGSEKTKIVSLPDKFIINGDWVYYVVPGKDNLYQLRRMKLDGSQDVGLNAYKVDSFAITGGWIYYRNSGNGNIYKMSLDGSSREEFPDKITVKTVQDVRVSIKKGEAYSFPGAVQAEMEDESTQYFTVTWDKTNLDTSKAGTYSFYGTIDGYTNKVKLIVEVSDN
ncbi:cell wall-binding repeat-containing protein [Clostridium thailandense]|uniref:cell wall-binding repeat-containing protein n=1 Tax=Clostridium thailandense TaxID=2794346 RepID=UPI0039897878